MNEKVWLHEMAQLQKSFAFLNSCDVIDIGFANGTVMEVYVAISLEQRQKGLSDVSHLDTDGMLFSYASPSLVPFHMKNMTMPLDIAWYDTSGKLIQKKSVPANHPSPMYCSKPFSYVLEALQGTIPAEDLEVIASG